MNMLPLSESGQLDAEWLADKIGQPVESAQVRNMTTMGGMAGSFNHLDIVLQEKSEDGTNKKLTLVIKTIPEANLQTSLTMNLWREANFYNLLADKLPENLVPKTWYAEGDPETGRKVILMENLEHHIPCGVFFGPGNPNNWALASKLDSMVEAAGGQTAAEVASEVFKLHARLHAQFWKSEDMLKNEWLQGAPWLVGKGEEKWNAQQAMIKADYDKMLKKIEDGESPVEYSEHFLACMKHSFDSVSWKDFQEQIHSRPWTVVQGDCHAGNALWPSKPGMERGVTLIDFEVVGLGSGAQELGQFVISHMTPEVRRANEKRLVEEYHTELIANLQARGLDEEASKYTLDQAWAEYVAGGIGRWMFFVPLLTRYPGEKMQAFFRDQLAAFLEDHAKDLTTVGMPRV